VSVGKTSAQESKDSPQFLDFTGFLNERSGFLKNDSDCLGNLGGMAILLGSEN